MQVTIAFAELNHNSRTDAVTTTSNNEEDPPSHPRSITSSKVQAMVQKVQDIQGDTHGLDILKLPGFVYLIS